MGWNGCNSWRSVDDVVNGVRENIRDGVDIIKSALVGLEFWMLLQSKRTGDVFIAIALIDGNSFMYKLMDESEGPYYYKCPIEYLTIAPVVNEKWRAGVRSWWATRGVVI